MRKSGKTTRLVDFTIQRLFEEGEIILLTKLPNRCEEKGMTAEQITMLSRFIDVDATRSNKAQEFFIKTLLRRLSTEHTGRFYIEGFPEYIKIKTDKYL